MPAYRDPTIHVIFCWIYRCNSRHRSLAVSRSTLAPGRPMRCSRTWPTLGPATQVWACIGSACVPANIPAGLVTYSDWLSGPNGAYAKPPENAYDPNGTKAPVKLGAAEGFDDPKGGESWVPNPNPRSGGSSNGWLDSKGRVWCPTGQTPGRAHGGPHWDVQDGKDNINVRPGNDINGLI